MSTEPALTYRQIIARKLAVAYANRMRARRYLPTFAGQEPEPPAPDYASWDDVEAEFTKKGVGICPSYLEGFEATVDDICQILPALAEVIDRDADLSSLLIAAQEENSRLRAKLADSEKVISYVENTYADYSVSHKDFRVKAAQMADDYRNGATGDNADE